MNFLKYSLIRIGLMAAAFALCWVLGIGPYLSAVFAVVIGLAVGYLALPRLHAAASADVAKVFRRKKRSRAAEAAEHDAESEDAYVDQRLEDEGRYV